MTNLERILIKIRNDVFTHVKQFFEVTSRFENRYILNLDVIKDSSIEGTPIVSEFQIFNLNQLPLGSIVIGDVSEYEFFANARVLSWNDIPRRGKDLESSSTHEFTFKINVTLSYNCEKNEIEILNCSIR